MFSKFYIKFNYKYIVPFNLKKKKLRVHANLIANKAVSAEGFFFGVKVKFWYYYYGINGLKKDSTLLIKNSLNKKLSVFFISNFNMIEGKWALPRFYQEYYQRYWFLQKKKINLIKINLIKNLNYNIYNLNFLLKNLNFLLKNLKQSYLNIYKINIFYSKFNYYNKFFQKKKIYYNKFLIKNYIPLIYKKKKKQNIIIQNLKNKKYILHYNINQNLFGKFCNSLGVITMKEKNIIMFFIMKSFLNVKQFYKLYYIINQNIKNNIIFFFYKLYYFYKFTKIYKNNYLKNYEKQFIKILFKQNIYKKKKSIKYINILKKKLKYYYVFKIFYNNFIKKKKIFLYKKYLKKYNNILKKKKIFLIYYINFYLFGKFELIFLIKNKKITKRKNKNKKLKKLNFWIKALYFKKHYIYNLKVKQIIMKFLNQNMNLKRKM